MRSEPGSTSPFAAALALVGMVGVAVPAVGNATLLTVSVCGDAAPARIPVRHRGPDHDVSCTMACHATEDRKRRATGL